MLSSERPLRMTFDRRASAIRAALSGDGACDRVADVERAGDAFGVFALDVEPAARALLDALFAHPRVVCVEIEQRAGGWRAGVVYWRGATGTLAKDEADAASPAEALARCAQALTVDGVRLSQHSI